MTKSVKDSAEHTAFDDRDAQTTPFLSVQRTQQLSSGGSLEQPSREKTMRVAPRPAAIPNKPWEPCFKLKLNPPDYIKMRWVRGVSVYAEMTITNTGGAPQCYKMKCTDNSQFRVRPPMNFIDQGATVTVKIIHHSYALPEHGKHYFAIYHVKCTPEDVRSRNFKRIWRKDAQPDGVTRIPVAFDAGGGGNANAANSSRALTTTAPASSTITATPKALSTPACKGSPAVTVKPSSSKSRMRGVAKKK